MAERKRISMRDDLAFTPDELHAFLNLVGDLPADLIAMDDALATFILKVARGHDAVCDGMKMAEQIEESYAIARRNRMEMQAVRDEIPFVAFSGSELATFPELKKGDTIVCPHCSEEHRVDASIPEMLLFYTCHGKTYLAGVNGWNVMGQRDNSPPSFQH